MSISQPGILDPDPGAPQPRIQAQAGSGPIPDLPTVECLLFLVAHHWSIREPFNRQVELLERFFDQDQMKAALTNAGGGRVAGEARQQKDWSHEDGDQGTCGGRPHGCKDAG